MDGADLDPPAYGHLDDDDFLMSEEAEEDQFVSDESVFIEEEDQSVCIESVFIAEEDQFVCIESDFMAEEAEEDQAMSDESDLMTVEAEEDQFVSDESDLMAEEDQSVSDESEDEEKDYPYLNPPAYGHTDDGERPPFVLIEPDAYFVDRDNATTASCEMRDLGGNFKVTFCTAHPPLVSYMCVHASAFDHTQFAVEPHIIAAETNGGLILLRFVIGRDPSDMMSIAARQYFIYDASGPSLKHLPHPRYHIFNEHSVAIVRKCNKRSQEEHHDCSNCDYVLAAQSRGFGYDKSSHLCLYQSDTETWRKVPVVVKSYPSHIASKTLTIGGDKGTVAWVDLWHNVLLCDVLDKRPVLRILELPPPIMPRNAPGSGHPGSVRNIALLGSFIKYVELRASPVKKGPSRDNSSTSYTWKVAVWSIKAGSSSSKDWHMDYLLNSTEIPESSLPKLRVDEDAAQPTLSTLNIGLPNLSLLDDSIVYFLTKIDYRDNSHIAWVLAVDMRSKTVQKVDEFSSRRTVGLCEGYIASRISKYLKGAPGVKQTMKRPGVTFLKSSSKKHVGNSMVINLGGA